MRRIAIINQKGGVGKTTTTANLGAAIAQTGARVLLVDLDPQAHLSLHFGSEVAPDQPSIYDVLTAGTPLRDILRTVRDNISVAPADIDLAAAEPELISVTGREVILREAIDAVAGGFDVMLIDCPPSLGVLTINALVASSEVIIPLQAHFFALQGLGKLLNTVTLVRQRINPALRVSGVVLCMYESTTRLATEIVDDLTNFLAAARGTSVPWSDARVFDARIRRNIKLAESSSFGQTVFDYAPRSNGALDYMNLAAEVLNIGAGRAPAAGAQPPESPAPAVAASAAPTTPPDAARERIAAIRETNGAVATHGPVAPASPRNRERSAKEISAPLSQAPAPATTPAAQATTPAPHAATSCAAV